MNFSEMTLSVELIIYIILCVIMWFIVKMHPNSKNI